MHYTNAKVHLLSRPELNWQGLSDYLVSIGTEQDEHGYPTFLEDRISDVALPDAEMLVESAGRICYKSWEPGLNKNVTRVRQDRANYFENVMASAHGSVLEHAQFSFILQNVSRVVTHELVRHRAGTAISQESGRFVRQDDIPFFMPYWMLDDSYEYLREEIDEYIKQGEELQKMMAAWFQLDNPETPFAEKKAKTSFMRRIAPEGRTTDLIWSANVRTLRHVIDVRTDPAAEEEIRIVFGQIAKIMQTEVPLLFQDFHEYANGHWKPLHKKV